MGNHFARYVTGLGHHYKSDNQQMNMAACPNSSHYYYAIEGNTLNYNFV